MMAAVLTDRACSAVAIMQPAGSEILRNGSTRDELTLGASLLETSLAGSRRGYFTSSVAKHVCGKEMLSIGHYHSLQLLGSYVHRFPKSCEPNGLLVRLIYLADVIGRFDLFYSCLCIHIYMFSFIITNRPLFLCIARVCCYRPYPSFNYYTNIFIKLFANLSLPNT